MESNSHKSFEIPIRTAKLVFEGEYEGAEVRCRLDVSVDLFLDYARIDETDPAQIEQAFHRFSEEVLLDWNLNVNGKPVEAHPEGMLHIPVSMANLILGAWRKAVIASPLAETNESNGGSSMPSANGGAARRRRSSPNRRPSRSPS